MTQSAIDPTSKDAAHRPKVLGRTWASRRPTGLPDYAAELEALHRAQGASFRAWLDGLSFSPHARILDVGCGDGFYTKYFADRLQPPGVVVGLDFNPAFLRRARQKSAHERITWRCDDVHRVWFPEAHFDLVFVGQGLRSIPRPKRLLKTLRTWTRRGGQLVIMENDRIHQALLPWSATTELQMKDAELDLAKRADHDPGVGVGRSLLRWLSEADWTGCAVHPQVVTRPTPLQPEDLAYARLAMEAARRRGWSYLDEAARKELRQMVSGRRFREPYGFATYMYLWFTASKA